MLEELQQVKQKNGVKHTGSHSFTDVRDLDEGPRKGSSPITDCGVDISAGSSATNTSLLHIGVGA